MTAVSDLNHPPFLIHVQTLTAPPWLPQCREKHPHSTPCFGAQPGAGRRWLQKGSHGNVR